MIVSRVEAATLHAPYLRDRADRYTEETRSQLEEAAQVPGTVYVAAQRLREAFRLRMAALLAGVDALALPTTLVPAPRAEEAEAYLLVLSRNCIPWSFIGVPAISVPCGRTAEGLPVGVQLVSAAFTDAGLLGLAAAVEGLGLGPGAPPSGGAVDAAR
jgi:aspartyl-tRNA(Asn)/glutamyl-tRNA(Gln) amidotransferase subunit A